jgi:signal transduction histidine kinase
VIERRWPTGIAETEFPSRQFERVHLEIGRIKKVVDAFVKFARQGDLTVEDFDFSALVVEVVASFAPIFAEAGVRIECDAAPGGTLQGDRVKLGEAVGAILQSATDAMRGAGGGGLRLKLVVERKRVRLFVRDSGPALEGERLRNVFEPYAQARDQEGFGLTVAKTVIESHGGEVEAASPPGVGCEVQVTLPRRLS